MDDYFVNAYGFDMRQLDPQLPEAARTFDTNNFLQTPTHENVACYQLHQLKLKYQKYFDALAHLTNTGQGVVIERSCYSDFVFVEAMLRAGYISKDFHRAYYEIRENVMDFLLKPHLVIYLDVPIDGVQVRIPFISEYSIYKMLTFNHYEYFQNKIKQRNAPHEVNSPALKNVNYLKDIEYFYKHEFLKDISVSSELLVYDWSNGGEVELVVEDIERIGMIMPTQQNDMLIHSLRHISLYILFI